MRLKEVTESARQVVDEELNKLAQHEKEILSVKMVSQHQSKDSDSKKNGGKELGMVTPQEKSSKKMKFASSSAETEPTSQTTISDDSKSGRGMSTMPRVVKRKLQKLRPIVEYNKRGKGIGQAHSEMQSYIGVLARSRVPLVDMKWAQIPKDIKEQIWEAVDIAFCALRLSKDFESVHSQHAQIREKLEYNHRLSRKGYAGLEDQLEETMPGVEIDRSTLWKRARQDKHGNIPDPKVAEKAKLIDELQKQVSEGKVSVSGSNDVLTMALGPEHPGRLRGVGAGISPRQYFNLPKPQRMSLDDRLKESLRVLLQEENKNMEVKAREEALRMEARTKQLVEAEREHFLSQLSQLILNFDPSMLKPRISQSPKNPMSDKASCSGGDVMAQDDVRTTQNSGVYLLAHTMQVASAKDKNPILSNMGFYGVIQEIWDLDYQKFTIPVFRCDWIDSSGLVVDELGFTLVDLSKIGHRNDQFVLASQVKQIFFVDDPMHRGWSVVLSMPNREYNDVIGDEVLGDVIIECEPFTRGMPNVDTFDELVGELGGQNIRDGCEDIWIE
ncbi:hypothetical protein L3X38_018683 [Prunus dulcis]|uniref:DUF4216 domain-containing protein n=1 Tax=Prunus dulcis TaxID=3755 RepID=A0AAD4ZB87_PRUDU|nr:hypothetical protein L3X38_018683 [Prunus dulcis]